MAKVKVSKAKKFYGAKLRLKKFLLHEAGTLISSYKRLLTIGRGVSNDQAPNKKIPNGKNWLIETGETKREGFNKSSTNTSMKVTGSRNKHSSGRLTYRQLFDLHNTAMTKTGHERYSGIFRKLPLGSKMFDRMKDEIDKQVQPQIAALLKKKIKVNIK